MEENNKIYLVVEDAGFYTEGQEAEYIDIIDVNGMTHSRVLFACRQDRQTAETVLRRIVENEAEEWETDPELKSIQACGSDEYIDGFYLLGSFYYIQEISVAIL